VAGRRDRGGDEALEVPVQSFSDIAFLLIIFFILVTSLTQIAGIVTDIPSGQKAEAKSEKTNIVSIHNGEIALNDAELSVESLRKKLKGLKLEKKKGDEKIIMLEATGKVAYQQYYEVMTSITAAGGVIAIVQDAGEGKSGK
jgi:biopolymer transport protein ExbD